MSGERLAPSPLHDSLDDALQLGYEELDRLDLSSVADLDNDFQHIKDEKLLAMLGEMAKGAPDDDASEIMSVLPPEVVEEEPVVKALVAECERMWTEVQEEAQAKRTLHVRLLRDLKQIQERSDRQYTESSHLMQRLMEAKQVLADKLTAASTANQDLRARVDGEIAGNARLRHLMDHGVQQMLSLVAEINSQISDIGVEQASLVQELQSATDEQARLHSELQHERVSTWRQSTDVLMAFAGRNHPPVEGSDLEAQQIKDLAKILTIQEDARMQLEATLNDIAKTAPVGLRIDVGSVLDKVPPSWEDPSHLDTISMLREVERLHAELTELRRHQGRLAAEEQQAKDQLQQEQDELSALRAQLQDGEAQCEEHERELAQGQAFLGTLTAEIQAEQASLREKQQAALKRREFFRSQVDDKRKELARLSDSNKRLMTEVDAQMGCFGGRPRPHLRSAA